MKKIVSLAIAIVLPMLAIAQNEDIVGNHSVGNFKQEANFKANFASGIKCTLTNEGVLTSLGMIGKGSGAEAQLAIYSDDNGIPNQLLAISERSQVTNGEIKLKVKPVKLAAGEYWIMGLYDQEGAHVFSDDKDEEKQVYYSEVQFGTKFPSSGADFQTYKGHNFAYFLGMKAGSSTSGMNVSLIYPNPTSGLFLVNNNSDKSMTVEVFDFLGNRKTIVKSEEKVISIDLSQMRNGNYMVVINGSISKKIVKI